MIFFSLLHYTMCRGVITQLKGDELPRPLRPPVRKSNKAKYYYIFSMAVCKSLPLELPTGQ